MPSSRYSSRNFILAPRVSDVPQDQTSVQWRIGGSDIEQHHTNEANVNMSEASDLKQAVEADPLGPTERARSNFVRDMVQRRVVSALASTTWSNPTPKRIEAKP